jgi:uncharacterized membrane protein
MIITIYALIMLLLFSVEEEYEIVTPIALLFVILAIVGIAHIILITIAIIRDATAKKLGASWIWGVLTFAFGMPIALIYALFTHKIEKHNDTASRRKNLLCALLSVLLCIIFIAGIPLFSMYTQHYRDTHFSNCSVYYETETGEHSSPTNKINKPIKASP